MLKRSASFLSPKRCAERFPIHRKQHFYPAISNQNKILGAVALETTNLQTSDFDETAMFRKYSFSLSAKISRNERVMQAVDLASTLTHVAEANCIDFSSRSVAFLRRCNYQLLMFSM